ncbi:hypothetical protein Anapl_13956 [Anas platyrhynchos]|uniref:Uncharacterized protein n=1 Tax=Anas platyrhynchos TaxID=8839 RepID=R0LT41_ANAPL|nr:hypothetical protein Anapl_13956 [Anas platyrhynchos]
MPISAFRLATLPCASCLFYPEHAIQSIMMELDAPIFDTSRLSASSPAAGSIGSKAVCKTQQFQQCFCEGGCLLEGQKAGELCFADKNGEFGLSCAPSVPVSQVVLVRMSWGTRILKTGAVTLSRVRSLLAASAACRCNFTPAVKLSGMAVGLAHTCWKV